MKRKIKLDLLSSLIMVITSKQISADLLNSVVIDIGKYEIDYLNNLLKY